MRLWSRAGTSERKQQQMRPFMKVDICIRNKLTGCRELTELLTAKIQSYGVADGTHLVVRSGQWRRFKKSGNDHGVG